MFPPALSPDPSAGWLWFCSFLSLLGATAILHIVLYWRIHLKKKRIGAITEQQQQLQQQPIGPFFVMPPVPGGGPDDASLQVMMPPNELQMRFSFAQVMTFYTQDSVSTCLVAAASALMPITASAFNMVTIGKVVPRNTIIGTFQVKKCVEFVKNERGSW